MSNLTYATHL